MLFDFPMRATPATATDQSPNAKLSGCNPEPSRFGRKLAAREVLFRAGDARTSFFRVETGAICLYEPRWQDERSIIDFAFPGDFVGLGFLETQSCNASAVCKSQVSCLPWSQLTSAIASDTSAQLKLQIAIEREFELRRTSSVARGYQFPLERVAAFLLALSHNNASEGRDPDIVGDSMECGLAADYLGLDVDELADLLIELRRRRLIGPSSAHGIRILDNTALEELANGRSEFTQVKHFAAPYKIPEVQGTLGHHLSAA